MMGGEEVIPPRQLYCTCNLPCFPTHLGSISQVERRILDKELDIMVAEAQSQVFTLTVMDSILKGMGFVLKWRISY